MALSVRSPFLSSDVTVEFDEQIAQGTLKSLFIHCANQLSRVKVDLGVELSMDEQRRRRSWALFFNSFDDYWCHLRANVSCGSFKSSNLTLDTIISTFYRPGESCVVNIDIGGSITCMLLSDELDVQSGPFVQMPIESNLNIGVLIYLLLLRGFSFNKALEFERRLSNCKNYGIEFGTDVCWKYFDRQSRMEDLRNFYQKSLSPNTCDLRIVSRGQIRFNIISTSLFMEFPFSDLNNYALPYLIKSGQDGNIQELYGSEKLRTLIINSESGVLLRIGQRREYLVGEIDSEFEKAFQGYLTRGTMLLADETYRESMLELENILREKKGRFVAVCAPSLTGKTQLAFSMPTMHVVYLPLNSAGTSQQIYKCYAPKIKALISAVKEDCEIMRNLKVESDRGGIYSATKIKETFLSLNRSFSVGFLLTLISKTLALVKNGVSFIEAYTRVPSFTYECRTIEEFESSVKSGYRLSNDMEEKTFPDVAVLLDEFIAYESSAQNGDESLSGPFAATLRNIVRAVNVCCLVMGTDSTLINLIDPKSADVSRLGKAWCTVVTKLPPFPESLINSSHQAAIDLGSQKMSLSSAGDAENNKIQWSNFFKSQILSSRPGISWCVLELLEKINSSDVLTLPQIVQSLRKFLITRKPSFQKCIEGTVWSFLGNQVHGGKSIVAEKDKDPDGSLIVRKCVNHHFYYLRWKRAYMRGVKLDNSTFGTFAFRVDRGSEAKAPANYRTESSEDEFLEDHQFENLMSLEPANEEKGFNDAEDGNEGGSSSIIPNITPNEIFDEVELMGPRAYLPPPSRETFLYLAIWNEWILQQCLKYTCDGKYSLMTSMNQINDATVSPIDGDAMERLGVCVLINASHQKAWAPYLGGWDFFSSVIANVRPEYTNIADTERFDSISCELFESSCLEAFPNPLPPNLAQFFSSIRIPYLSPCGEAFPKELCSLTNGRFGYCIRVSNHFCTDFIFEMMCIQKLENEIKQIKCVGIAEMKEWVSKRIHLGHISAVLSRISTSETKAQYLSVMNHDGKRLWGSCRLHLLFCHFVSQSVLDCTKVVEREPNELLVTDGGFNRRIFTNGQASECLKSVETLKVDIAARKLEKKEKAAQQRKERKKKLKNPDYVPLAKKEKVNRKKQAPLECPDISPDKFFESMDQLGINVYLVDQYQKEGQVQYRMRIVYEDPRNELISIILPISKQIESPQRIKRESEISTHHLATSIDRESIR